MRVNIYLILTLFYLFGDVSCRPTQQVFHYVGLVERSLLFSYYFRFFYCFRYDLSIELPNSLRAQCQTALRARALSVVCPVTKKKEGTFFNVHFILYSRFYACDFSKLFRWDVESCLCYFILSIRLFPNSVFGLRVPREDVWFFGYCILDFEYTRGWEELRVFIFELEEGDPWAEGIDFMEGRREVKTEAYFMLVRGRRGGPVGQGMVCVEIRGGVELWRVCY